MVIKVKVNTAAKQPSVAKIENVYEVKFKAAREKGQANLRLIEILAEHFQVPKSAIKIIRGHTSTHKVVEIDAQE